MGNVYDPLPVINRIEALATRLSSAMGEFEDRISNHPDVPVDDMLRGTLDKASIEARLQQYLDESDPGAPDFIERVQRASDGIRHIRELTPKGSRRAEDTRARATYPVLERILGKALAAFSDTKDGACRFFVAYYRDFGMSPPAQLELLRHADAATVAGIAMKHLSGNEDALKVIEEINDVTSTQIFFVGLLERLLEGEGRASEDAKNTLGSLDHTRLFLQFTSSLMSVEKLHGTHFETAASLIVAAAKLKQVFLAVMPYALIDVEYEADPKLLEVVAQLEAELDGAQAVYLADTAGEYLDVREVTVVQEQHPEFMSGDIIDLETIRNLHFTHAAKTDRIVRDCEEVIIAARHGAFKLATVGCGGLLETLLREFVHRKKAEVAELKAGAEWGAIFSRKSVYVQESDILTWDLFTLINVSAMLFSQDDAELAGHCHKLRAARNKIHGGSVGKEICTFAISVLKAVVSYLT